MDSRIADVLDLIQAARREFDELKRDEKRLIDQIDVYDKALNQKRIQIESSQANMNKLELNLRSALAGTPYTVDVPPVADVILDQVGREG